MPSDHEPTPRPPDAPAAPSAAPTGRGWPWALACAAAAAALTALTFWPAVRNQFLQTWDDGHFVVGNELIRHVDGEALRKLLTAELVHYWAPLTWLSLALDHALWGPDPFGFHLTNVLLHALNAALAFLVARRLLALPAAGVPARAVPWAALLAALLWSLHPLRVESVAWVVERKSVLTLAFGLLATLAWLRHAAAGPDGPFWRSRWYWLAALLFALSLAAKPVLVTWPVVLLILSAWPLRRLGPGRTGAVVLEVLPLLAMSGALSVLFTLTSNHELTFPLSEIGLAQRLVTTLRSVGDYTLHVLWPAGLSPFYLHPGPISLADPAFLVPAALVTAGTVLLLARARRHPAPAAAWLAWLAALAPGIMSTQVSDTAMADRFTYFAALPLSLLVAGGVARALGARPRRQVLAGAAAAALILAALAGLSVRQVAVWRDDVSLWSRPIELEPRRSGRVYTQRSMAREVVGDLAGARTDMDAAIALAAARRFARMDMLYERRAGLAASLGDLEAAADDYGRALETEGSPDRARQLRARAAVHQAMGRQDLADEDLRRAGP